VARLIFATQLVDADDPIMGFVVPQVQRLAGLIDVVVIANEVRAVPDGFAAEVVTLGKERGRNQMARGLSYVSAVSRELRRAPTLAILAHMGPIYACLAAPAARRHRAPVMLWFAHPADTITLRVAEHLSDTVLTTFPGSYPRPARKVRVIGQAIDTDTFTWSPPLPRNHRPLRLVALGRTAPVKGYDVMIRALGVVRAAGVDAELRIVGPSSTGADRRHRTELEQLTQECAAGAVRFDGGVRRSEVAAVLREADVLVNATESGSADKVVLEAMAVGRPVLASSVSFSPLLGEATLPLSFPDRDVAVLADRIAMIASEPVDEIERTTRVLRRRVEDEHSTQHFAESVVSIATELSARRRHPRTAAR
jgi:glycosyltransferase involved in cell wall biosynthesis